MCCAIIVCCLFMVIQLVTVLGLSLVLVQCFMFHTFTNQQEADSRKKCGWIRIINKWVLHISATSLISTWKPNFPLPKNENKCCPALDSTQMRCNESIFTGAYNCQGGEKCTYLRAYITPIVCPKQNSGIIVELTLTHQLERKTVKSFDDKYREIGI